MDISTQDIKSKIYSLNNDYEAHTKTTSKINGCSVIIPVHNQWEELLYCIRSLSRQKNKKMFEVIIVDDHSSRLINIDKILKLSDKINIKIFRLKRNVGAAASRNIGVSRSKYNLLIFLDSDMVIPKNFLSEYIKINKKFSKIISVGFRKHIQFDLLNRKIKTNIYKTPSHKFDFRYKKFIPIIWKNKFPNIDKNVFGRYHYILRETSNFREFGRGKRVGIWDLPFMVVSSSMAIRRNDFVAVGGFDDRFKGCWYEDTHLGAKLIAMGLKVIPVTQITSYHLLRNKEDNTNKNQLIKINKKLYYRLINERLIKTTKNKFINNINQKYGSIITKIA